jgi:hypothetical protein
MIRKLGIVVGFTGALVWLLFFLPGQWDRLRGGPERREQKRLALRARQADYDRKYFAQGETSCRNEARIQGWIFQGSHIEIESNTHPSPNLVCTFWTDKEGDRRVSHHYNPAWLPVERSK